MTRTSTANNVPFYTHKGVTVWFLGSSAYLVFGDSLVRIEDDHRFAGYFPTTDRERAEFTRKFAETALGA